MRGFTLFALATMLLVSCDKNAGDNQELIEVDSDDSEMNAAIDEARSSLGEFLEERSRDPEKFSGLLKVYFEESEETGDDGEHMWVRLADAKDDRFNGVLLSSPGWLKSVKQGDMVEFETSDVTDWLYTRDGKAVGAYTVQVLRSRMSADEREEHDANYPFSFD